MKAMILAAGLGTRLLPYTSLRPKPLFPVLGRPLLLLIVAALRRAGFGPVLVNAHHLRKQIADLLAHEDSVVVQMEEKILGTGGGLRRAASFFDNAPALVVNGDIYHDIDLAMVYKDHLASGARVTMVLHDNTRFNRVLVDADGKVLGFGGRCPPGCVMRAFTGIHVIDPLLLARIPPIIPYDIINFYRTLIKEGVAIRACIVRGHFWTDIGTPADYLNLHAGLLLKTCPPPPGLSGITGPFHLAEGVVTADSVRLNDWVSIGAGARVGAGASLTRVVVWDGAVIGPGVSVCDEVIPC